MTRGVQEGNGIAVDLNRVGTDMLRDAAGLAGDHIGLTHGIEEAGLAVVDVAHDHDDGAAAHQFVFRIYMVVNEAFFDGDNDLPLHLAAQLCGDEFRRVEVDGLIDGGHDTVFDEDLDQLRGGLLHAGGQLAHGDLVGDFHRQRRLLDDLKLQPPHLLLLLVAALVAHRAFVLILIFALVADLLLAAGVILHPLGHQIVHPVVKAVGVDGDGLGVDHAAFPLALLHLGLLRLFGGLGLGLSGRGLGGLFFRALGCFLGLLLLRRGRYSKHLCD